MIVGAGLYRYEWLDQWAKLPSSESTRKNGRTHAVVVTSGGDVVVFVQAEPGVMVYDEEGKLRGTWGDRFSGAHGMTLVHEVEAEYLWLTDEYSGEVVKTTLDGQTICSIPRPLVQGRYSPTWVAVSPVSGDIWVADGYGTSIVRRYDNAGKYVGQITGEEGAGRFRTPHGIAFAPEGTLLIADRKNERVAIYTGEGEYLEHRDKVTHSPCSFGFQGGLVYVAELFGSVKILDGSLNLVGEIGANPEVRPSGGWPNQTGWGWPTLSGWPNLAGTPHVRPGRFCSPHGIAVAPNGDIYVVEWIVGGRITKLAKEDWCHGL